MPMKQLLLLRHAKPSWDDPALADFDRPLGARGLKTPPLTGRELARRGWLPDLALVSPALRTRDTWRLVAVELPKTVPAQFAEELYEAAAGAILARVRQARATSLLVIGHNPGLQHFALRLAGTGFRRERVQEDRGEIPDGGARAIHAGRGLGGSRLSRRAADALREAEGSGVAPEACRYNEQGGGFARRLRYFQRC